MYTPTVVAFSGSARAESYNSRLVRIAAEAARAEGARVTLVDWRELPLTLMDEDEEKAHGIPKNAKVFKELLKSHDGFLISAPEYNSSITPLLKTAIDWASRREGDEKPLVAFAGKTAALMSASPGALGGLRGLVHVRAILGNIQVLVLPNQVAISKANEALEGPRLKDPQQLASIEALAKSLVAMLRKLHG
jgi:NAD(P)H-dependent FMN reductase